MSVVDYAGAQALGDVTIEIRWNHAILLKGRIIMTFSLWKGWALLDPLGPKGVAGGAVTAVPAPYDPNHVDLFITDQVGTVWSTFKTAPDAPYGGWFPVHDTVRMQPGATVTARWASNTHLDLYVTGTDGAVWSIYWEQPNGWKTTDWFTIHPEITKGVAGATVTAISGPDPNHVDLFITDRVGTVWSTFKTAPDAPYGGWFPVHDTVRMQPGATVTAQWKEWPGNPHHDLFVTGTDGAVWSIYWEQPQGWNTTNWFVIRTEGLDEIEIEGNTWTPVFMHPGAPITVRWADDTRLDIYAIANDGTVWSDHWGLVTSMTLDVTAMPTQGNVPFVVEVDVRPADSNSIVSGEIVGLDYNGKRTTKGATTDTDFTIAAPGSGTLTVSRTGYVDPGVKTTLTRTFQISGTTPSNSGGSGNSGGGKTGGGGTTTGATPTCAVEVDYSRFGDSVTVIVSGGGFESGEPVDITEDTNFAKQVTADSRGSFHAEIGDYESKPQVTHTFQATGETSHRVSSKAGAQY